MIMTLGSDLLFGQELKDYLWRSDNDKNIMSCLIQATSDDLCVLQSRVHPLVES